MEILQAINSGTQVLNSAGMSVSGLVADFETARVLIYKGAMVGGFLVQQRRAISMLFAMIVQAISGIVNFYAENEKAMNDAAFDLLRKIQMGLGFKTGTRNIQRGVAFCRPIAGSNTSTACWLDGHLQNAVPVAVPVSDDFSAKPWLR